MLYYYVTNRRKYLKYAAPMRDLQDSLEKGSLGVLEPFPWVMMTGNCLGWVVYGYYQRDPFLVAANLPGLLLSLWLNMGASKLQYKQFWEEQQRHASLNRQHVVEQWDASPASLGGDGGQATGLSFVAEERHEDATPAHSVSRSSELSFSNHEHSNEYIRGNLILAPQERSLMILLAAWCAVIVWAGWFLPFASSSPNSPGQIVGLVVNMNLIFFYGAPLKAVKKVISSGESSSIHAPTMMMNWTNTSFWIAYGVIQQDPVVIVPNTIGLSLGIIQGVLCCLYPRKVPQTTDMTDLQPLQQMPEFSIEDHDNGVHVETRQVI